MTVGKWIRRAGWTLVALCLLGMLTARTVARWVSPNYAVVTCRGGDTDPWGEPWVIRGGGPSAADHHPTPTLYCSKGPNRKDGDRDDIYVLIAYSQAFGAGGVPWHYPLHCRPKLVFGALALLLTWLLRLGPALTAARGGTRRELFCAALITIPPALLVYAGVDLFRDLVSYSLARRIHDFEFMLGETFPAAIPPFAAAIGSLTVLGYLLALAFRLRRRPAPGGSSASGGAGLETDTETDTETETEGETDPFRA